MCAQVQKRRIYDITNVLEGVGLLRKQGKKNEVQWVAAPEALMGGDDHAVADLTGGMTGDADQLQDEISILQVRVRA